MKFRSEYRTSPVGGDPVASSNTAASMAGRPRRDSKKGLCAMSPDVWVSRWVNVVSGRGKLGSHRSTLSSRLSMSRVANTRVKVTLQTTLVSEARS